MKSVIQNEMTIAIAHEKDIKTFFGGKNVDLLNRWYL